MRTEMGELRHELSAVQPALQELRREVAREEAARRFEALSELNDCRRALEAASKELAAVRRTDELKQDRRRARPAPCMP